MKIKKSLAVLGASASLALGFGGVMAPSAQATSTAWGDGEIRYAQTDLRTGTMRSGVAYEAPRGTSVYSPGPSTSVHCSHTWTSGRTFVISCTGQRWRAYVHCTDGSRYITPAKYGWKRVAVHCPAGTQVEDGGAYGR